MIFDLSEIFSGDQDFIDIDYELDLSDILLSEQKIFDNPIHIVGRIQNHAGIVTCDYTADIFMSAICDRCLDRFDISRKQKFSSTLLTDANDEENTEHYICENSLLDFDDMARTDILLSIPSKLLCSENCNGLCDQCGAKLDEDGGCSCSSNQIDPRLEKLKQLLEN